MMLSTFQTGDRRASSMTTDSTGPTWSGDDRLAYRLLVAEDNAHDVRLLKLALSDWASSAELLVADTFTKALAIASLHPVDLLLLDLGLPDSNGLQTLRTALKHLPDVPIVVMTGHDDETTARQVLQEGAQDFLSKRDLTTRGGRRLVTRSLRHAVERHQILRELREANRLRSMFVATASHELRTPLAIIQDYAGLLSDGTAGPLAGLQEECVGAIMRNCRRLGDLVGDLLDVAKMESGTISLRLESTSVDALLAQCHSDFLQRCRDKGQRLDLQIEPELPDIHCDRGRMMQVIVNLLANAHRFTPEGGAISLSARREQDDLRIDVTDSGVGISTEEQGRIFDAFVQVDRRSGAGYEGTGLGLFIAQRIILMHGGTINVESTPGSGSRFRITLPASVRCSRLSSLRAALVTLSGRAPGLVTERTSIVWLSPVTRGPNSDASETRIPLGEIEATATTLFRRHDSVFGSDADCLVACLLQGSEDDAMGFLRRLARAFAGRSADIGYQVCTVDGRAPDTSATPPAPLNLTPLSHLRNPR
ncbi:MAG: HAMP domain-containing sensor histidine kinase [Vicinamibacterales bacterium]